MKKQWLQKLKVFLFIPLHEPVQSHQTHEDKCMAMRELWSPYKSKCCKVKLDIGCSGWSSWEPLFWSCGKCHNPTDFKGYFQIHDFDYINKNRNKYPTTKQ